MSNQARLLAEDTPHPPAPAASDGRPSADTLFVAGCADRVPVFWLFCFGGDDLTHDRGDEGPVPALVAEMDKVRQRLADRDRRARELFPEHEAIWERWRRAVEAVERQYLKADVSGIQRLCADEDELACQLSEALDWFELSNDAELGHLLALAGIKNYDPEARRFTPDEGGPCAEALLCGRLGPG